MRKSRKSPRTPGLPAGGPPAAAATVQPKAPAAALPKTEWRRHFLILLGLWVAALAFYSNSFQTGLPFDNALIVGNDPRVRAVTADNLRLIFEKDYWYPSMSVGLYRPLSTLSLLFNWAVLGNGLHPFGYHAVNFAIQAANIALVYILGLMLLEEASWAWLLAALWTLHPLLTESITNIVGRADQLAALGVFAGLLCHMRAASETGRRKNAWLLGLAVAAAVAIFSKESGIVLVAAMLCYDLTFGRGAPWKSRLAGYAAIVPAFAGFFYLRGQMLDRAATTVISFVDNPLVKASGPAGFLTAIKVIGKYLWLYAWPMRLSADYSYNQIPVAVDAGGIISLVICVAAAAVAFREWRRGKNLVPFAILFFFAVLSPTSNLLIRVGSIMAERWMYLPSFALALLAVWGLGTLARRFPAVPKRALAAAALLVCLAWGVRAYERNFDWRDDLTLWRTADEVSPESCKPSSAVSNLLATSAHPSLDEAIRYSERSLAILDPLSDDDNIPRPWAVAGMCYRLKADSLPDPAQKRPLYEKALADLLRAKRIDVAAGEQLNRASRAAGKPAFLGGLGLMYLELGRVQRRLSLWRDALASLDYGRMLVSMPEFAEEKSQVFQDMGDNNQAAIALLEGMMMDLRSQRLANRMVRFYKQTAPLTCAVQTQGAESSFNPDCPMVHQQICEASQNVVIAYRNFGKPILAEEAARRAVAGLGCPANRF